MRRKDSIEWIFDCESMMKSEFIQNSSEKIHQNLSQLF